MIYSEQEFGEKSQISLMKGVRTMSKAVGSTLGPQGLNVAIAYASIYGEIWMRHVVHDGVTVAKSIDLKDEFENMGAQLLKQAAQKQVDQVGDGTTVSIILAHAILEQFQQLLAANVNPMKLRKSLEKTVDNLVSEIEKLAIPVKELSQMKHVASVSAQDEKLGAMVADVISEMGIDGLVDVQESKNSDTTVEKQKGLQFDKGWVNPYFMTDPDRLEATLENPLLLITDSPIISLTEFGETIQKIADAKKNLVIISPHFSQDAIGALLVNKSRGVFSSICIQAPSFGQDQKNKLQDMAIATGATFISEDAGLKLKDIKIEHFGKCEYVKATKTETLITGGKGTKEAIKERIENIRKSLEIEEVAFDQEKMKERIAKLTIGVSVIKVGGATEVEMKERLERVKDAVGATKAAMKKGIVPGGEIVYLLARERIKNQTTKGKAIFSKSGGITKKDVEKLETANPDQDLLIEGNGKNIEFWAAPLSREDMLAQDLLYKALYEPFRKLLTNAGMNDGEHFAYWTLSKVKNKGIDVMDEKIKDMVKSGIVDPVLVPINALLNASSVAIQIATTGATIIQRFVNTNPNKQ